MEKTMRLEVKKLHPDARIPKYQSEGAAGFDLHALVNKDYKASHTCMKDGKPVKVICPKEIGIVKTGLSVAVPPGYEMQVRPRSGLAAKKCITVENSPGTVDSDYRGEIMVILRNEGTDYFIVHDGDRIAQAVIAPVEQATIVEVEELSETARGSGGLGSTGSS